MEYTTRTQVKGENGYAISSIDYVLGILHTYATLNAPDSTLDYEYHLIDLPGADPLVPLLKDHFFIFRNQEVELVAITEPAFKNALSAWFFKNGMMSHLPFDERRISREVDHFCAVLRDVLDIVSVSLVANLSDQLEAIYLELGVGYQYFILHADGKNYMLCFRYDD